MAKSSKLVSVKRGRVLLVRRKRDGLWMFPGGRKRARESDKECLRREMKEELPKLKLGRLRLWKEVKAKNSHSGRKMSDAIFVTAEASGRLTIGDKKEIDKATWRKPRGIRLTPTSRYIRDKLYPNRIRSAFPWFESYQAASASLYDQVWMTGWRLTSSMPAITRSLSSCFDVTRM